MEKVLRNLKQDAVRPVDFLTFPLVDFSLWTNRNL